VVFIVILIVLESTSRYLSSNKCVKLQQ